MKPTRRGLSRPHIPVNVPLLLVGFALIFVDGA
jgi:hypothetical protein